MDVLGVCLLILVALTFALFLIRIVFLFHHNITLARELKRLSREANARRCNTVSNIELRNQTGNQPPKDDFPPAYDDVMQGYVNAKLALQAAEEGQVRQQAALAQGNSLTNAHSTVTIETFVDANAGSSNDLSDATRVTTVTAIGTTAPNNSTLDSTALPPTYERLS